MTLIGRANIGKHLGVGARMLDKLLAREDFPVARLNSGGVEYVVTTDKLIDLWAVSRYSDKLVDKKEKFTGSRFKKGNGKEVSHRRQAAIKRISRRATVHVQWQD